MCNVAQARSTTAKREWWWLGGEQKAPVFVEQWALYDSQVQYHLSASYESMLLEGRDAGILLDLAPFTDPPSPYQVWRDRPYEVYNKSEPALLGRLAIAGFTKDLWNLPTTQLPLAAKEGRIVAGFFQVRSDHTHLLKDLQSYLANPASPAWVGDLPRRRVVLLIEIDRPAFIYADVDRFRKKKAVEARSTEDGDIVPPGEAVFQWWFGDPRGSWGHWKNYHPHVSAKLEQALAVNERFRTCQEPVPIDDVRYCLQRISRDCTFDYLEKQLEGNFREPFMPESVVTVNHVLFDEPTRMMNNCFVQFQQGNPKRRRPVRRIRRGEAAGLESQTGEPCGICFSDSGVLTGCSKAHVICNSCLRAGLRSIVGDVSHQTKLLCGCLDPSDKIAFEGLAKRADSTLQASINSKGQSPEEQQEMNMELAQIRTSFGCTLRIPPDIFQVKVQAWQELLRIRATEHLFHVCQSPGCSSDNWILRTDFTEKYRKFGKYIWECKAGHRNCLLPPQSDIDEMNRSILQHPEFYAGACAHDGVPLRRFRLCPECVKEGLLTFAVHESGCKQWPGYGKGHRHVFCFACTAKWTTTGIFQQHVPPPQPAPYFPWFSPQETPVAAASSPRCGHGNEQCNDPGLQQVRRIKGPGGYDQLEIGFVNAKAYIKWINNEGPCPPTVFRNGAETVLGSTRQGLLGLEVLSELKRLMNEGTQ